MSTIITKNSSTASAVPLAGDLVKGELAVNVTDKKLYTKDNSATVVKVVGSLGNQEANAVAISGGTVAGVAQTGGTINNTPIGATTASTVRGTTVTATTGFTGDLTGNVTGNTTGVHTGAVTGDVTGNLTGNVTVSSGTSSFNNVTINGTLDMNSGSAGTITGLATPSGSTDAANKGYVDTAISNLIGTAPSTLDTLGEIADALNDDANIAATLTAQIAAKVSKSGDSMTGALAMGSNKITGLGTPTASTDAATKGYVDTADATKLNLSGGTMTGNIVMGANKVTSTATPTTDDDLTRKAYVDSILGSATSAATSASAAATSATNAANSASAAASSASSASASASAAAASYDSFDDRYLGSKATAPTVDNDGNALLTGALYWNSTSSNLWVWSGSAWTQATLTAGSFATLVGTETLINKTFGNPTVVDVNSSSTALRITQTGTGNALVVEDSANPDSTPFVVDAGGNVISGAVSNIGALAVVREGFNTITQQSNATSGGNFFNQRRSLGTNASPTVVSSGIVLGEHGFVGYDGASYLTAALIRSEVDGTPGTNDMPGRLVFSTTADGASSPTERMRIDSAGTVQFSADYKEGVVTANTGTAYTISLATGTVQILTLTGNCTFTFPTATAGKSFIMLLKQDGTGSRTVTWPASVKWPAGTAPTITSTASKLDKYIFTADGTNWYGSDAGKNYTV